MVFRASEYGESKVESFLTSSLVGATGGRGGRGLRPVTSPCNHQADLGDHRARRRMPPPQVHRRKKGGGCCLIFSHFMFLWDLKNMKWGGGVSSALPILSNFLRGHFAKEKTWNLSSFCIQDCFQLSSLPEVFQ